MKLHDFLQSAVTVSLHFLQKMFVFKSHIWQEAYYCKWKWTFKDLLPCNCYAIKTYSRTICS